MTRSRVNLKLIPSESARKVSFKKRKQGLVKKMEEITTLCAIDACMVIYNPQKNEPHVWPSMEKAMELMDRYERMPKSNQDNKKVDHEKFMKDRVAKLLEHIEKWEKKNKEAKASLLMYQLNQGKTMKDINILEVEILYWFSEVKLNEINRQIYLLPPVGLPSRDPSQLLLTPQTSIPPPSDFFPHPFLVEPPPPQSSFFPQPFLVEPPPPPSNLFQHHFPVELPPPPPTLFSPLIPNQGTFVGGSNQNEERMAIESPSYYGDEMFLDGDISRDDN